MINGLLSIIIPVYNAELYIKDCLLSVLNQKYYNIEVIVIDDGSTDSTNIIVNDLIKLDSRVKIYKKENGGVSSARNFGLDKINGEFITFVDADDTVCDNMYTSMIHFFDNQNCDIVCCGVNTISLDGKVSIKNNVKECDIDSRDAIAETLLGTKLNFSVYDKIFRSILFNENNIRFPSGKTMEEAFILPLIYNKAHIIHHVGIPLYNYYAREGSYVTKPLNKEVYNIYDTIEFYKSNYAKNDKIKNALEYFEFKNKIDLYRRAILERRIIDKQIYSVIKIKFNNCFLDILKSKSINLKLKIMAIETKFHLHVLRKRRAR